MQNDKMPQIKETTEPDIGSAIRRIRKTAGVSQVEFSNILGLEQSAISRIEKNQQMLTATQFKTCAQFFGILMDDIVSGVINYWQIAEKFNRAPPFPARYLKLPYSKVREILPLVFFLNGTKGPAYTKTLLSRFEVDSILLLNPDQKIGTHLNLDLARELISRSILTPQSFGRLIEATRVSYVHGFLSGVYDVQASPLDLVRCWVMNSSHYESNFSYKILDLSKKEMEISVEPQDHMHGTEYRDDILGDFLCKYHRNYFKYFPKYRDFGPLKLTEETCHFKDKSNKCVYKISAA
jgi:transcriptional regulator with XRE-family HTH domain